MISFIHPWVSHFGTKNTYIYRPNVLGNSSQFLAK
jgi:hypothetical protein